MAAQSNNSMDAWSRACDAFCDGLTPDEARIFATATLENTIEEAQRPLSEYRSGRISHGIQAIATGIAQYGEALDVFSNTAPLILGPLWGSLRLVILLASEYGKYFEKLLDMFLRISDVLPRFKAYETLFPYNERLRDNIYKAYLELLRFSTSAKDVFRNRKPSILYLRVAFKLTWKPFEQQFGRVLDSFWQHQKTIDREASLSHMIEAGNSRNIEEESRSLIRARQRDEDRIKSIALLSKIKYEDHHRRQQGLRHRGTGTWLLETTEFKTWNLDRTSCCLSCFGIPGSGKTVLCSSLIDHVQSSENPPAVCYYYFDYADERTLSTAAALGSIIKQLLLRPGRYTDEIEYHIKYMYHEGLRSPAKEELVKLLCLAAGGPQPTHIFIDGLDEGDKEVQDDILFTIDQLSNTSEALTKVFLSFREDSRILKQLKTSYKIKLSEARLTGDIVCFVQDTVKAKIDEGLLIVKDKTLEGEIVGELISKACGMFLWVSLQLDEICDNTQSDSSIRETLRNLPIGLEATYQRIIDKISRSPKRHHRIAHRMLMWVLCAKRPLSLPEVKDAIFFEPNQESWDGGRIPGENSTEGLIRTCKNLVVFDEISRTLRPCHHTVRQFLSAERFSKVSDKSPNWCSLDPDCKDTQNNFLESANLWLGRCCVAYLSLSDFETQVTQQGPQLSLAPLEMFASNGLRTLPVSLGMPRYISAPHYAWSRSRIQAAPSAATFATFVEPRPAKEPISQALEAEYPLLKYIAENWTAHISEFVNLDVKAVSENEWESFRHLVFEKTLMFDFRPWQSMNHPKETDIDPIPDLPFMQLFDWAVENGVAPFLLVLEHPPYGAPLSEYCLHYWLTYSFKDMQRSKNHTITQKLLVAGLPLTICSLIDASRTSMEFFLIQLLNFDLDFVPYTRRVAQARMPTFSLDFYPNPHTFLSTPMESPKNLGCLALVKLFLASGVMPVHEYVSRTDRPETLEQRYIDLALGIIRYDFTNGRDCETGLMVLGVLLQAQFSQGAKNRVLLEAARRCLKDLAEPIRVHEEGFMRAKEGNEIHTSN